MSFNTVSQNSVTMNSTDSTKKSTTTATEQLNSTAKVFCEACNQIVKAYLVNYHEKNMFQTISLSFAQKVIKKTKISFSQLVVTLVYLNRYYQSCILLNKHIPGHEEAVIPSLSHVVLLCIIQAERYITDIPHKLSWWAGICAGQTKSSDINKWQRDFFNTINYKLTVHPEKDYNIFKVEVKRLAARLFNNSVVMPPQFRRSVCVGSQVTPTSAPSSQIQQLPSQPNIISTSSSISTNTTVQPRILLSPLYSGNSNTNQQSQTAILSSQTNMITSPLASVHSDNSVGPTVQPLQSQNLGVPVLNITNTNLTTSPVELSDNSMINQTRSPSSIYNNSLPNDTHSINSTSPLPPTQNPNHLMVQTNVRSPIRNISTSSNSLLVLTNNQHNAPTKSTASPSSTIQLGEKLTSSPVLIQSMVDSPLDMAKKEEVIENTKTFMPRPIKRKRSYYDHFPAAMTENFLKASQSIKRSKMAMTISPEELNYQPNTSNSRPIEENNKKENNSSFQLTNKTIVVSPQIQIHRPSEDNSPNHNFFLGEGNSFPYIIDKGKYEEVSSSESDSLSHPFRITEKSMTGNVENSFLNTIETIPNSNIRDVMDPLDNNVAASSDEITATSLLLAAKNSTSITRKPVSPPYTPK